MNIHGLIIEGIAGTGKSTFLYEFLKSKYWTEKPFISSLVLSEHHTLRVLEQKSLNNTWQFSDSLDLLDSHVGTLESMHANLAMTDWLERDRKAQRLPYVFERFHLSHAYHFESLSWTDVAPIDKRLNALNAKLCLFTIAPEDIKARIIDDYKKAGWQDYLATLGDNEEQITNHFLAKQNQILSYAKKSLLPTQVFDTSKMSTHELIKSVSSYYEPY